MRKYSIVAGVFYLLALPGIGIIVLSKHFFPAGLIPIGVILVSVPLGLALGPRVGLRSLLLSRLSGERVAGLGSGVAHAAICALFLWLLRVVPTHTFASLSPLRNEQYSLWVALSMGAVVEELIFRWGAMSLVLFFLWKWLGRGSEKPGAPLYWSAVALSSVLSTSVHLNNIWSIGVSAVSSCGLFILGANFIAGLIFAWTFWKKGLEFTMITHGLAHVFIVVLGNL